MTRDIYDKVVKEFLDWRRTHVYTGIESGFSLFLKQKYCNHSKLSHFVKADVGPAYLDVEWDVCDNCGERLNFKVLNSIIKDD